MRIQHFLVQTSWHVQTSIVCCSLKGTVHLKIKILSSYSPLCWSKPLLFSFTKGNDGQLKWIVIYTVKLRKRRQKKKNHNKTHKTLHNSSNVIFVWVKKSKLSILIFPSVFHLCHVIFVTIFKYKIAQNANLTSMDEIWKLWQGK